MTSLGYSPIHETAAFIQFAPDTGGAMRVDLMLVGDSTFQKLHLASETKSYGGRTIQIASVLHLVALKLHATRTWNRAVLGKDYYDILNLIQIRRVNKKLHSIIVKKMCLHILFSGASPPCFWGRAVGSRYPRHLG
jgi:hypothetical protein